ncbi:chromosome partitioning protein ParA [Haemophilus parahaemolyticus]|uniref:Chromosome partitioning protein ParA n=2 Tax=Haemophilus parahaemolyticus TaxID=735 RepID=A0AAE6MN67_HAEPH|nr:bacteriophage CI repressor protein [Haemophilus parahaemolyticus HK385]QEN10112.1 chromosome partitioning protein ParA [Haemophilus parahaemolyticus]STO66043.1 bacteriophage ci repressor protein [Haemophilus parahaemolyticus HK385]
MLSEEKVNSIEFVERLKKVADVKEDQALAEIFGLSKASFSYAKKNNSFSAEMLSNFAERFNCDLHWLITGKEKTQALKATEKMLLTAFNELDDKQQLQAVVFVGNLAQGGTSSPTANISQHAGENAYNVGGDFNFNQK